METIEKIEITPEMPLEKIIQNGQHPYLKHKKIRLRPVSNLKFEGQTLSELPQGFMLDNQQYPLCLPIDAKTGQLVNVIDSIKKNYCPEYREDLTELEFFTREIGVNVSTTLRDNNFWKAYTDPQTGESRHSFDVVIPKNGLELDLSKPYDVLKAKIVQANKKYIAPSWEEKLDRPTYKFAIVDEFKQIDSKKEKLDKMAKALAIYTSEYKGNQEKLINFIKVENPTAKVSKATNLAALETKVGELASEQPDRFFQVHEDPFFIIKTKIFKAIEVGYLIYATKTTFKTVNDEPLGTIHDLIGLMKNDENFLNRIEKEIQDK